MSVNTGQVAFFEIVNSNLYTPYLTASNYDLSIRTDTVAQRLFLGTGSNANSNAGIMISSNNVNIYGNLTTSNMVVMGTLTACNVEYVMSNITIYNNETVKSNLTVSGIVTCGSNLTIGGGLALSNTTGIVNISSSGSYLGVGKTPAYNLDVNGNVNFTGALTQNGVAFTSGGGSQWTSSGANVYVGSGSNVGIGKNPAYALDVVGNVNMTGGIYNGGTQMISFASGSVASDVYCPWSGNQLSYSSISSYTTLAATCVLTSQSMSSLNGTYIVSCSSLSTTMAVGNNAAYASGNNWYTPTRADGSSTTVSGTNYSGAWAQLQTPNIFATKAFVLQVNGTITFNVVFCGSTNGSTWTLLFSGNPSNGNLTYVTNYVTPVSYNYFRLIFTTYPTSTVEMSGMFSLYGTTYNTTNQVSINGTLSKTAGSFDISHPNQNKASLGYRLRHCFVESPTRGDNIYRFKVEATVDNYIETIKLDDYWHDLNENPQVWVTRNDGFGHGYGIIDSTLSTLAVNCERAGNYDVLLIGTRKDQDAIDFFDNSGGVEYIKH